MMILNLQTDIKSKPLRLLELQTLHLELKS